MIVERLQQGLTVMAGDDVRSDTGERIITQVAQGKRFQFIHTRTREGGHRSTLLINGAATSTG